MVHGLLNTDFRRECMAVIRRWVSTFSRSHMSIPRCSSNIACVVKSEMNIEIPRVREDLIFSNFSLEDISPFRGATDGVQSQGGSLECFLACVILKFTSGATPADCMEVRSMWLKFSPIKKFKKPTWWAINADNVFIIFIFHKGNVSQM